MSGSATPATLAKGACTLADFETEAVELENAETLQVLYETPFDHMLEGLPPGLHPTLPPVTSFFVWNAPESPWGSFAVALQRIACRSGARPRGLVRAGYCNNAEASAALAGRWGFTLAPAEVAIDRGYHRSQASVRVAGREVLSLGFHDPVALAPSDVQYTAHLNLAETPRGLRLVQVDCDVAPEIAERGRPFLETFDPSTWVAGATPQHAISASITVGRLALPRLRFLCRPDVMAFQGTEPVS